MAKAAHGEQSTNAMDYKEHEKTYASFLKLFKWGVIINLALLIGMALAFFATGGGMAMAIFITIVLSLAYYFVFGY